MSHKLTSNQSVIYNSEYQTSGVLEIIPEQVIYQNDGSHHSVMLTYPIKDSNTDQYIGGLAYNPTETEWNDFFSSQTLTSTNEFDKQEEVALKYALTKIEGNWGLSSSDWIYTS